jgi:signal transduction histidine kinase
MKYSFNLIFSIFTLFVVFALSIPFVMSVKEYYTSVNKSIELAQQEQKGSDILGVLLKVQQHFFEHVMLGIADESFGWHAQVAYLKSEILEKNLGLQEEIAQEQANLAFVDIESAHLRAAEEKNEKKRIMLWLEFASDANFLSSLIVDKSSLILDSDKDSYYLIDIIVNHYPKFIKSIFTVLLDENADLVELHRHLMSEDYRALKGSLKDSLIFDKDFNGESVTLQLSLKKILKDMDDIMFGPLSEISKLKKLASYLSDSIPQLNDQLKSLLKQRVEHILVLRDEKIKNIVMNWFLVLYIIAMSFIFILYSRNKMQKIILGQQKQLEISSRLASVGEFTASIGHEIVNPVSAISGFVEVIQTRVNRMPDSPDKEKIKHFLERINRNTSRVIGIVKSLKNLIKDEKATEAHPVVLKDIMADVEQIFNSKLITEQIKLEVKLENENLACFGSEIEIFQIITNLVSNSIGALKSAEDKNITIDVSKNDGQVIIVIADSGSGIPESLKSRIFEPLFTTKVEGTGLGLQISVKLAQRMNGTLKLRNSVRGACFELCLPEVSVTTTNGIKAS